MSTQGIGNISPRILSNPRLSCLGVGLAIAIVAQSSASLGEGVTAQEPMEARVMKLTPSLDVYIENGMKAFDLPGLAMGIVVGDKLVYAKGFGINRKGGAAVDSETVFQIGSTTKAFLAATMAVAVDKGKFAWDDRIVDLYPEFQLKDPWVTREFRMFDIISQRSGLPPYANDSYGILGANETQKIQSLRHVEPESSFRSKFSYTNITHLVAQRIVARLMDAPDWQTVLAQEIFEPLGMTKSSTSLEAIEASINHAVGYDWSPSGVREVPFTRQMPYDFGGAGAINSTVIDLGKWVRLQLADGAFEGRTIVSAESLAATRTPRIAITDRVSYAMGWVLQSTPNGNVTFHNGSTLGFGSYVGMALDHDVGVIVLTNSKNVGLPDAIGAWTLDKLLGNPEVDYAAVKLKEAKAADGSDRRKFDRPADASASISFDPLAGAYANSVFGDATVKVNEGTLSILLTTIGTTLRLSPWSGDVFAVTVLPDGGRQALAENIGRAPIGFAHFQINSSGRMDSFNLTLAGKDEYLFTRK